MNQPERDQLSTLLRNGPVAVVTGAGLSTASGIPAYRDRDGHWQHSQPIQHQAFLASAATRRRYWARSFVGWPTMAKAAPNRGHHALAMLESMGIVATVITQNVDGLHREAGSQAVIELHGGIHRVRCLSCHDLYPRALVQQWLDAANPGFDREAAIAVRSAPDGDADVEGTRYAGFVVPACPSCDGLLKPDVVFFGDSVPRDRVDAASRAVATARALLVVGSSLMVYSGYRFAAQAHRLGKPVVAINQGITRADPLLRAKIDGDCGDVLIELASEYAGNSC